MLKISRAALFAATLGLAAPVLPAFAQDMPGQPTQPAPFSFEIKIPSVAAVESSMSEDQIKALFTADFLNNAEALARLTATSITIPEFTLAFAINDPAGGTSTTITYRDVVLANVRDGLAEKLTIGSSESNSQGTVSTSSAVTATAFDLKRLLEFAGIVKGDAAAPLKPLYASVTSGDGTQTSPVYSCTTVGSTSSAFEARPVSVTIGDLLAIFEKYKDVSAPPPEAINTFIAYGVDLLRAFRGGAGTIGAIDCSVPGETPISVKVAGGSNGNFESGVYPEINVSGIAVDAGALGSGGLGEFVFKPLDLNPTLNALESAAGNLSEAWFDKNWRLLIPSWDGFSLSNFTIDAINPENPSTGRIKAEVGYFDLSLGNYVVGIPTDVSMSALGVKVPLPQDSTDPQINTLLAAGLTGVNLGFNVAAAWDKAASIINVESVELSAVDLGGMSISATIGNATDQVFAVDPNVAMAAGFALTVKDMTINVTDEGLGKIVWPLAAAQQGKSDVEAFRSEMAQFAEGFAIQLIGRTDAARQLGIAVGDFVTGGKGELTINIKSKDPNGIPMAMFIAAQNDPSILAGQVEITGLAN